MALRPEPIKKNTANFDNKILISEQWKLFVDSMNKFTKHHNGDSVVL